MNLALNDQELDFLIVYLDDILIASNSREEYLEHLEYVLRKLREKGFRVNLDKCEWLQREVKFLGHTFSEVKASINQDTREAVSRFEKPKTKKQLQSFLELINWDRRFLPNLSRMTKPLELLLRKNVKFQWGNAQQTAFDEIKQAFEKAEDLFLLQKGVNIDASTTGLGAKLFQFSDEDPDKHFTIAYASRSLKGAEVNYTITELECLALVWAFKKWHTVLMGHKVRVFTDHRALKFLGTCTQNSDRIARWFEFLQEFELEIIHIPGKSTDVADALSRSFVVTPAKAKSDKTKYIILVNSHRDGEDIS